MFQTKDRSIAAMAVDLELHDTASAACIYYMHEGLTVLCQKLGLHDDSAGATSIPYNLLSKHA